MFGEDGYWVGDEDDADDDDSPLLLSVFLHHFLLSAPYQHLQIKSMQYHKSNALWITFFLKQIRVIKWQEELHANT